MARRATTTRRQRGFVRRRGNSYEVVVYAGVNPLTGKVSYLSKSTRDEREVDKIRTRLLGRVDERRVAATKATLGYTLDAWLDVHDAAPNTLASYRRTVDRTIRPALGDIPLAKITARTLEELYGQLRGDAAAAATGSLMLSTEPRGRTNAGPFVIDAGRVGRPRVSVRTMTAPPRAAT